MSESRGQYGAWRSTEAALGRLRRPVLSSTLVTLLISLWFSAFCNFAFWGAVRGLETINGAVFTISLFILVTLLINVIVSVVVWPKVDKPLVITLLMISAVVTFFTDMFGIAIDKFVVRSVIETDSREVREILSGSLVLHMLLFGILPSSLFFAVKIKYRPPAREILTRCAAVLLSIVTIATIGISLNRDYAAFLRNHKELRHLLTPINFLGATLSWSKEEMKHRGPVRAIGEDAKRGTESSPSGKHKLLILVVGETARAANFSLGSYARATNPRLAARKDVHFLDIEACGTSTAVSLPCMFSNLGRRGFSAAEASRQEGLLDVVKRSGAEVLWRENNSGCKGACDRVRMEVVSTAQDPELCRSGECWDEILLRGLRPSLDGLTRDAIVVLHQKGSHGPAYHRRYPDRFELFRPACRNDDISTCTAAEVVNAYDNSILYTDHMLAETIKLLESYSQRFDTAMLYVSDHGESLGEKGLYLHGMPYLLAPPEQTHVPMLVWMSQGFRARSNLADWPSPTAQLSGYTHDNLFHSTLGLLDIRTSVYREELDIFSRR